MSRPIPARSFTAVDFADGIWVPVPARMIFDLVLDLGVNAILEEGCNDHIERIELDLQDKGIVVHGFKTISAFGPDDNVLVAIHAPLRHHHRMNRIVEMIRTNGSADVVLDGETIKIGFAGSGMPGELTMLGGGYYFVRTTDGRRIEVAKGQLIEVVR